VTTYERHELNIMPDLTGSEWLAFLASIKASGQVHPITIYQGKVLDGWQRYRACVRFGIEPVVKAFEGDDLDALHYWRSMNLVRAHYTRDQQAAIQAGLEQWLEDRRPQQQSLFEVS
jgi:ParB-like chromosome segregation protein Spo0J